MFELDIDSPFALNDRVKPDADNDGDEVARLSGALDMLEGRKPSPPPVKSADVKPAADRVTSQTRKFQSARGLKVDGLARPNGPTAQRLAGELESRRQKNKPSPHVKKNGRNPHLPLYGNVGRDEANFPGDVRTVKSALALTGHVPKASALDPEKSGHFDDETETGIRGFKKAQGLPADGRVELYGRDHDLMSEVTGPKLRALLGEDVRKPEPFREPETRYVGRTMAFRPTTTRAFPVPPETRPDRDDWQIANGIAQTIATEMDEVDRYEAELSAQHGQPNLAKPTIYSPQTSQPSSGSNAARTAPNPPPRRPSNLAWQNKPVPWSPGEKFVVNPKTLPKPTGSLRHDDLSAIFKWEGGVRADVYIVRVGKPSIAHAKSGPTVGAGVDLGQRNWAEMQRLVRSYGLDPALARKLRPYLGLKGSAADRYVSSNPMHLETKEIASLQHAVYQDIRDKLERHYNNANSSSGNAKTFNSLPVRLRTVALSVALQHGPDLKTIMPRFWGHLLNDDVKAAVQELDNFGPNHKFRRTSEARYLDGTWSPEEWNEPTP